MKQTMCDLIEKKEKRITPVSITVLRTNEIFVFGSNPIGYHKGGAARTAIQWGAVQGKETGLYGNTYAIPTTFKTASEVEPYVSEFIRFAENHPEYIFYVTEIGCGHAGHEAKDIAFLFKDAVNIGNIYLPGAFWEVLNCSFSERIKSIISYYSISPFEFIDGIGLKSTHAMSLVLGIDYPSVNDIQKILIKYPEVNARWLLLGEGDLLDNKRVPKSLNIE